LKCIWVFLFIVSWTFGFGCDNHVPFLWNIYCLLAFFTGFPFLPSFYLKKNVGDVLPVQLLAYKNPTLSPYEVVLLIGVFKIMRFTTTSLIFLAISFGSSYLFLFWLHHLTLNHQLIFYSWISQD
jgi:hypothetical protein